MNFFHELEDGDQLRLMPFDDESINVKYNFYYIEELKKFFVLDINSKIQFKDTVWRKRSTRYFNVIEYNDKLYIIKTGIKVMTKISEYFSDDTGTDYYTKDYLLNKNIKLIIDKKFRSGFPDYDVTTIRENITNPNIDTSDIIESDEYKELMSNFNHYIDGMRLEYRPDIIKYLEDNNLFIGNYQYLLRGIKINEIRSKKINTTKTKLWEPVIKMIGETTSDNESMEDIGFLKEDKNDDEVHQFMVNGYLFEIKLVDKILG